MRTLKGQNVPNIDETNPADFPHGRPKDASGGLQNGTQLTEKTTMTDTKYALLHVMKQAQVDPDETPESISNSQFFDAAHRLWGNVGQIVTMGGEPLPGARLLKLDGATIDLKEPKFKYLKEWYDLNRDDVSWPASATDWYGTRQTRFKIINSGDPYVVTLPKFLPGLTLVSWGSAAAGYILKHYDKDGTPGLNKHIYGRSESHTHQIGEQVGNASAHTHTVTDNGHTHDRGTFEIIGGIKDVNCVEAKANETYGAFSSVNERHSGPVNSYSNRTVDIEFHASRNWTGYAGRSQSGISISSVGGDGTVRIPAHDTGYQAYSGTTGGGANLNVPYGVPVNYFICY